MGARGTAPDARLWPQARVFVVAGRRYHVPVEFVPAVAEALEKGVAPAKLVPLLRSLDRDFHAAMKRHETRRKQEWASRATWADDAVRMHLKGYSHARIGSLMESRGRGNAQRIARTLAAMLQPGTIRIGPKRPAKK